MVHSVRLADARPTEGAATVAAHAAWAAQLVMIDRRFTGCCR